MKKETVVCDFDCRVLADAACALCNKDGCSKHLPHAIALSFGVVAQQQVVKVLVCASCTQRFMSTFDAAFDAELGAALKQFVDDVKARFAERALDESPPVVPPSLNPWWKTRL